MFEMHGFQSVYAFLTGKEAAGTTVERISKQLPLRYRKDDGCTPCIDDHHRPPSERSNASGELELAAKVSESDCAAACQAVSKQML